MYSLQSSKCLRRKVEQYTLYKSSPLVFVFEAVPAKNVQPNWIKNNTTNNTFTSSRWERLRKRINTPRKKPQSKHFKFDTDVGTIRQGYLSDNAIKCSLEGKEQVHVIDSAVATCYKDSLAALITALRDEPDIEDVFVVLHFNGPPEHFACLHVKKSSLVYYDSLRNYKNQRPFNEYPGLRDLGEMEFHVPAKDEWQVEEECGCMGGVAILAIVS